VENRTKKKSGIRKGTLQGVRSTIGSAGRKKKMEEAHGAGLSSVGKWRAVS